VLEELVTNIIAYGYTDKKEHIIFIRIKKSDDILTVEVKDDGRAFNPLDMPPPDKSSDLENIEPGGLGIHLVRKLTDEVFYQRENNCNILTFKKKCPR
jgi:anti-sigma regulatory factor (Ser/Thr protein kinase)